MADPLTTPRQDEVRDLLAKGLRQRDIARVLDISKQRVSEIVAQLRAKEKVS